MHKRYCEKRVIGWTLLLQEKGNIASSFRFKPRRYPYQVL